MYLEFISTCFSNTTCVYMYLSSTRWQVQPKDQSSSSVFPHLIISPVLQGPSSLRLSHTCPFPFAYTTRDMQQPTPSMRMHCCSAAWRVWAYGTFLRVKRQKVTFKVKRSFGLHGSWGEMDAVEEDRCIHFVCNNIDRFAFYCGALSLQHLGYTVVVVFN